MITFTCSSCYRPCLSYYDLNCHIDENHTEKIVKIKELNKDENKE